MIQRPNLKKGDRIINYCKICDQMEFMRYEGIQEGVGRRWYVFTCLETGSTRMYKNIGIKNDTPTPLFKSAFQKRMGKRSEVARHG